MGTNGPKPSWLQLNADFIAAVIAFFLVGQFLTPKGPGWVPLVVFGGVYFAVQWFVPGTRGGIGWTPWKK